MGFFKRISDIVSANLNDMAEQFEDPEKMLRQAIREMEESISEVTQQTAKAMANEKTLQRELDRNQAQADEWQRRAGTAVDAGDDELAKKALTRKNEHAKLVSALEDQLESAREASVALRRQLDGMKAKLSEGQRNLATLAARKRAADFRRKMDSQAAGVNADVDYDAFAKFDRLKSKVEQAEAEADALAELRGSDRKAATPVEDLQEDDLDVAAELAELKRAKKS